MYIKVLAEIRRNSAEIFRQNVQLEHVKTDLYIFLQKTWLLVRIELLSFLVLQIPFKHSYILSSKASRILNVSPDALELQFWEEKTQLCFWELSKCRFRRLILGTQPWSLDQWGCIGRNNSKAPNLGKITKQKDLLKEGQSTSYKSCQGLL